MATNVTTAQYREVRFGPLEIDQNIPGYCQNQRILRQQKEIYKDVSTTILRKKKDDKDMTTTINTTYSAARTRC